MQRRVALAIVASALGVAVLVLAASSGSLRIWDRPGTGAVLTPPPQLLPSVSAAAATGSAASQQPNQPAGYGILGAVIDIALLMLLAALVLLLILYLWRKRKHLLPERDDAMQTFEVLPELPAAIVRDADAALAALSTGPPRNAIVACWQRLEEVIAVAGFVRDPAETSAELTARVLTTYAVDQRAIAELAALYREARFSTHPLGEPARAAAVRALQALHADVRRHRPAEQTR